MRKRYVLRPYVLPTAYILLILATITFAVKATYKGRNRNVVDDNITYVSDTIFEDTTPVINEEKYVLIPYVGNNVELKIGYYNEKDNNDNQEKSIVKYDSTYIQNSGLTYTSEEKFDVVTIMDGTVSKVYDNDILETIVEITHDNNIKSIYQMVSNVKVSEGQSVREGETIAESGTSKILPTGNNLYFEVIKEGSVIDPNNIIGKNIKDI